MDGAGAAVVQTPGLVSFMAPEPTPLACPSLQRAALHLGQMVGLSAVPEDFIFPGLGTGPRASTPSSIPAFLNILFWDGDLLSG